MLKEFENKKYQLEIDMRKFILNKNNDLIERFRVLTLLNPKPKSDIYDIPTNTNPLLYNWLHDSSNEFTRESVYTYEDLLDKFNYCIDEEDNPQKEGYPSIENILSESVNSCVFGCKYDW